MHNIIQMETSAKLYSLPFGNVKTYLFALLFVAGNIALPQLCHLVPAGGPTLLPIYFFTLIAAYKYGFKVGLLTAILSPLDHSTSPGKSAHPEFPRPYSISLFQQKRKPLPKTEDLLFPALQSVP